MKWLILLGIFVYIVTQTKVTTTYSGTSLDDVDGIVSSTVDKMTEPTISEIGKTVEKSVNIQKYLERK